MVWGNDPRMSFRIGNIGLFSRPVSRFMTRKKKSAAPGGVEKGQLPGFVSRLPALPGPVLIAVLDLIRHTRLDYFLGNARIGLGDPASTGMLYGLYRAIVAILPQDRINFNLAPEFSGEVFEIDLKTRFHISFPICVIVNAVRIIKNPVSQRIMNKPFRKAPAKVAG